MTDEELLERLRDAPADGLGTENLCIAAADRIEALVKERDQWIEHTKNAVWADSEELKLANARAERLEAALHNCVGMLDQLVAESGRDIEWGAEDPFRMGEWFEPDDLKQLEQARAALKGADHD